MKFHKPVMSFICEYWIYFECGANKMSKNPTKWDFLKERDISNINSALTTKYKLFGQTHCVTREASKKRKKKFYGKVNIWILYPGAVWLYKAIKHVGNLCMMQMMIYIYIYIYMDTSKKFKCKINIQWLPKYFFSY
jgi:hypothetical protein